MSCNITRNHRSYVTSLHHIAIFNAFKIPLKGQNHTAPHKCICARSRTRMKPDYSIMFTFKASTFAVIAGSPAEQTPMVEYRQALISMEGSDNRRYNRAIFLLTTSRENHTPSQIRCATNRDAASVVMCDITFLKSRQNISDRWKLHQSPVEERFSSPQTNVWAHGSE